MNEVNVIVKGKILSFKSLNDYIYYKNGNIFKFNGKKEKIVRLEKNIFKFFASKISILRRMLRLEPRQALLLNNNEMLLTYKGFVYHLNIERKKLTKEHKFRNGMNNPLYLTKFNDKDGNVNILYGEYFNNNNRECVNIYSRMNNKWKIVYTFEEGLIRHIHNIIYDEFRNNIYILTGDNDEESAIWKSDLKFKDVKVFLGGNQRYRSCFATITKDKLYYLTDSPYDQNYLMSIDLKSKEEKVLISIDGPVIFGKTKFNKMIFSTSVEPDNEKTGIRSLLRRKLGSGVKSNYSILYEYEINNAIRKIISFEKDVLPPRLFQLGNIQIIWIEGDFVIYPMSVKRYLGKSLLIKNKFTTLVKREGDSIEK